MRRKIVLGSVIAALTVAGLATVATKAGAGGSKAIAALYDTAGAQVGNVQLSQRGETVTVVASARNIPAGFHGFHVHDVGLCEANAVNASGAPTPFFTAGPHYKGSGADHPTHAGDMPVLLSLGTRAQSESFRTDRFTIRQLLEGNGTAIIVHAGPDDYTNPQTGNAGARIACGVVKPQG